MVTVSSASRDVNWSGEVQSRNTRQALDARDGKTKSFPRDDDG